MLRTHSDASRRARRPILLTRVGIAAAAVAALIVGVVVGAPLASADDLGNGVLSLGKTVSDDVITPGMQFDYQLTFGCSSTTTGCVDAKVVDEIPDPFEVAGDAIVAGGGDYDLSQSHGNTVIVAFHDKVPNTSPASTGLTAGTTGTITIPVKLTSSAPVEWDGRQVVNTGTITATNSTTVTAKATVRISVPASVKASLSKTWTPGSAIVNPGATSTVKLTARNSSNVAAGTLTVQDPTAIGGASSPFSAYDFGALGSVVMPQGADRVEVDAYANGAWVTGAAAASAALPSGVSAGDIEGIRLVFSSTTGATITANGSAATVEFTLAQRSTARGSSTSLAAGGTYTNVATGSVTTSRGDATAPDAKATQTVSPRSVAVSASKSFAPATIEAGGSTVATVTAKNTSNANIDTLTLAEPGTAGSFFDEGIQLTGIDKGASTWPTGATGATGAFTLVNPAATVPFTLDSATKVPALPTLASGQRIAGVSISWTGTIQPDASGSLALKIATTAAAASDAGNRQVVDTIAVTGHGDAGDAKASASATLTITKPSIALTLKKTITPSQVWPNGYSSVALQAHVPAGTATVNSDEIVVQEPQTTTDAYWDAFDLVAIAPTAVPAGSTLRVDALVGGTWKQGVATVDATGGAKYFDATIASLKLNPSTLQGIRFVFHDDGGFGRATTVQPNLTFQARDTLRSTGKSTHPGKYPNTTSYQDCAASTAHAITAGGGISADATSCATTAILSTDGGPGTIIAAKKWDAASVLAQTRTTTGAKLTWGTTVPGVDTMTVTDQSSASDVTKTPYDAFDLVRIDAISPTTSNADSTADSLIQWDTVTKVQLYHQGQGWQDITSEVCTTATACDGGFPGYTLTSAERGWATGVQITFAESKNRAARIASTHSATAPLVGSGVASSTTGRSIHLDLQLRDTLRSNASTWVTPDIAYNTTDKGVVDNAVTVSAYSTKSCRLTSRTEHDRIVITKTAETVTVTKTASPSTLVLPAAGQSAPTTTFTVTAKNTSPTPVWNMRITDPFACPTGQTNCAYPTTDNPFATAAYDASTNPFDVFDLTGVTITSSANSGIEQDETQVVLWHRAANGTLTSDVHSPAELPSLDLSDVDGVSVLVSGDNAQGGESTGATIAPNATVTIAYSVTLRATHRSTGAAVTASDVDNTALASIHDPVLWPNHDDQDVATTTVHIVAASVGVEASKSFSPDTEVLVTPMAPVTVTLGAVTKGTVAPKTVSVKDDDATFWNAFTLDSFSIRTAPTGADRVVVKALTPSGWVAADAVAIGSAALPAGVDPAGVTGLEFVFTRADGAALDGGKAQIALTVEVRDELRDSSGPVTSTDVATPMPGETRPGTVENTVTATVTRDDLSATDDADAAFTLTPGTAAIAVQKSSVGRSAAGQTVPWDLTFSNTGTGYLVNPVVVDTLPADGSLLYVPTEYAEYATSTGGLLTTDPTAITQTYDEAARTITWTFPEGAKLAPGETYTITVHLQIKPGLAADSTVLNTFGVTNDRSLTDPTCSAIQPSNGRAAHLVDGYCTTDNIVNVLSQGSFASWKGVKTDEGTATNTLVPALDCTADAQGFYRYPCAADTRIGATDTWKLTLTNGGNIASNDLQVVDRLPIPGDTGVIDTSARGTGYRPAFTGDLSFATSQGDGATLTWYVTTDAVPCSADLDPTSAGCPDGSWVPSSEIGKSVDAKDVTGIKLDFDFSSLPGGVLAPAATVDVTYTSTNIPSTSADDQRAPVTVPVADTVAWNSFGYEPSYVSGPRSAPQEPIKAGVRLPTGSLQVVKLLDGTDSMRAPDSFTATVTCTVDGAKVDMGDQGVVTLDTSNAMRVTITGIPLGAVCDIAETGSVGAFDEDARELDNGTVTVDTPGTDATEAETTTITNIYNPPEILPPDDCSGDNPNPDDCGVIVSPPGGGGNASPPGGTGLAFTGLAGLVWFVGGAGTLLVAGGVLLIVGRVRRRRA